MKIYHLSKLCSSLYLVTHGVLRRVCSRIRVVGLAASELSDRPALVSGIVCWFHGLMVGGLLLLVGCEAQSRRPGRAVPAREVRMTIDGAQDHLLLAMEFLDDSHRYDERENMLRIHHHLGKWIADQSAADDWVADPMVNRLPSRLNLRRDVTALTRLEFSDADLSMLREAIWLRDVSQQLVGREVTDPELRVWLSELELGYADLADLSQAIEIFDWVVRNIQLESFQDARKFADATGVEPPLRGTLRYPWEAMLIGRGDAWVRAQIAMLLARQLGISMVLLSIDAPDAEGDDPRPWAVAAFVNGQLYLFDTRLGLPIPGPAGRGIATLENLLDDPELLRQLDQPQARYWVTADDLRQVVVMIEASYPYLTQRMALLQAALPSRYKLNLTVAPSQLAQELRRARGVTQVSIWPMPYEVMNYRMANRGEQAFLMALTSVVTPFLGDNALANGRRQHLRGKWFSDPPRKGAKDYYMECRMPDEQIDNLVLDEAFLASLGIQGRLPDDPAFVDQFRTAQIARLRFFKRHASYWLGMIAFEQANYEVAKDFFEKRSLDVDPEGVFAHGARYALARCYEQQGRITGDSEWLVRAAELYEADSSPQRNGNRLRARRLRAALQDSEADQVAVSG